MSRSLSIYQQLGKRLQELRRKKRLTQSRLAELVALNRTSITNIEKGRQKILVHTLCDLAEALGVHPNQLLPEQVTTTTASDEPRLPQNLSRDEAKWIKTVMKGGDRHGVPQKDH